MTTQNCKWLTLDEQQVLLMDFSGVSDNNHLNHIMDQYDYHSLFSKENMCTEFLYSTDKQEDIWLQLIACQIPIDSKQIPTIILADITMEKQFEDQIQQKNNKINKLLQQKDNFILQIGHDLKTPLTPLLSILPLVKQKEKDPALQELLQTSIENVERIKIQIDKILKYAKLKSFGTEYNIQTVNLRPIVQEVFQQFKDDFKQNQIQVINGIDESLLVHADTSRLKEVFIQFVSNSIQFSRDKGQMKVYAEKMGDMITVSFQDTGIGLKKEQVDHIFDEFYKADDSRHTIGSSGLGLAMCKTIITKHGGDIWSFSMGDGKGVTFYFTLKEGKSNR